MGSVGANCPPCKEFGSTVLKKLYAADGIAEGALDPTTLRPPCVATPADSVLTRANPTLAAVAFDFHSAIRSAGSPATDH